jgi:MoaA/NifB/PqqE/SkfB family radical SAM enzyme
MQRLLPSGSTLIIPDGDERRQGKKYHRGNKRTRNFVYCAGGELLVRPEILTITKDFPESIFLLFTNGLLIDEELITRLKEQKNVVPVISIEGYEEDTDERRGKGVYERLQRIIGKVNSKGIFSGISLTVTRANFATVTDYQFIHHLIDLGCKMFFFVEYSPIEEGTEHWVITDEQRAGLWGLMNSFRAKFPAIFIAIPGDEEKFGGCLSAGRGFVHISAEGNLEPCPYAHILRPT